MKTEVTERYLIKRYKNWLGQQVIEVDNEYKIILGRHRQTVWDWGLKAYKKVNGNWKYICCYFAKRFFNYERKLQLNRYIEQIEYEYTLKKPYTL